MQITETGYYETREGGLAYVAGFAPESIRPHYPAIGLYKTKERWEYDTWNLEGLKLDPWNPSNTDLIRYIGKELPEEKPQPERVELSKLWAIWWKPNDRLCPYSFWKGDVLFDTKEKAIEYSPSTLLSYQKIAITPADATGFFPGEGLE